jgi:large subunit ribosomal protein L3
MGHRKKSAPRRGSLAFRPRARHGTLLARVRNWPEVELDEPSLLGFACFKAGCIHVITLDDREKTPNYGKPLFNSSTVLACPPMKVIGFRVYEETPYGYKAIGEVYSEKLPKELERKIRIKPKPFDEAIKKIERQFDKISRIYAIVAVIPKEAGLSQKKPFVFEVGISGGDIKKQFDYVKSLIGKEVRVSEVFKSGMFIDVLGVTKGKGFQGPVKRHGIKRKQHKSRKTVRIVGAIGPWHPAAVTYTVPMAGQMGFHQRTEYNKRILMIGNEKENPITPKGGFLHFGVIKGDYVVIAGSVPGPAKRVIVMRYPMRPKVKKVSEPQIIELSVKTQAARVK